MVVVTFSVSRLRVERFGDRAARRQGRFSEGGGGRRVDGAARPVAPTSSDAGCKLERERRRGPAQALSDSGYSAPLAAFVQRVRAGQLIFEGTGCARHRERLP